MIENTLKFLYAKIVFLDFVNLSLINVQSVIYNTSQKNTKSTKEGDI
jgi:hypothetical protein